jgi:hypothetical protein
MKKRLLFISGAGRCGSTLLDMALASASPFWSLGEARQLFRWGVAFNEICECGAQFRSCPYWRSVGDRFHNGWPDPHFGRAVDAAVCDYSRLRSAFLPAPRSTIQNDRLDGVRQLLNHLYESCLESAPLGSVLIDGSKKASYLDLLQVSLPSWEICVVDMRRRPSQVARAWSGESTSESIGRVNRYMRTQPRVKAYASAVGHNAAVARLVKGLPHLKVEYEDFCMRPWVELNRICHLLAIPSLYAEGQRTFLRREQHGISGNPVRFDSDREITVRKPMSTPTSLRR